MKSLNISLTASLVNGQGVQSSTSTGQGSSSSTAANVDPQIVASAVGRVVAALSSGGTSSTPGAQGTSNAFVNGQWAPSLTPTRDGSSNAIVNGQTSGHGSKLKCFFHLCFFFKPCA